MRRFVHPEELLCGEEVAVHYLSTCCNGSSLLHAHSIGAGTSSHNHRQAIVNTSPVLTRVQWTLGSWGLGARSVAWSQCLLQP